MSSYYNYETHNVEYDDSEAAVRHYPCCPCCDLWDEWHIGHGKDAHQDACTSGCFL